MEVVVDLGIVPGIENLVHDHESHAVSKLKPFWCGWIV
jgi:hypothetical protein